MCYRPRVYLGAAGEASAKGRGSAAAMAEFYRAHDNVFVEEAP